MPKIKSAIKRVDISEKCYLRNISYKSKIKTNINKFNLALSEKNQEEVNKYHKDSILFLNKSVNKGILTKKTSSRQKSRLTKKLNNFIKTEPTNKPNTTEILENQEKPIIKKEIKVTKKN